MTYGYQWQRCDETGGPCTDIGGATAAAYVPSSADRRGVIQVRVTASANGSTATATSAQTNPIAASSNPIVVENAKAGTSAWWPSSNLLTNDPRAQAYASETSVAPGATLHLHVSTTPSASYRVEIYRLGWYGGTGGRLITCMPSCTSTEQGASQSTAAPDPTTGELDAGWPVTDQVVVGSDWTSGYYEAKVVLTDSGLATLVPFIVNAPTGSAASAVVVQASVNTWEAYNNWGGKSLYDYNSSNQQQAYKVSFNRPYTDIMGQGPYYWELDLVRFLERNGIDTSYVTDADVDSNPALLAQHRLAISAGHDEYWTKAMRDGWEAARDSGTNLIFAGADAATWQMRYEDSSRTLVEYRSARLDPETDPTLKTVEFRQLATPRPECQLEGVQFGTEKGVNDPPISYTLAASAASDQFVQGTGLQVGQQLSDLVGYEYDATVPGCNVPGTPTVLLTDNGQPAPAQAEYYRAPSGALVFASGSMQFSWALQDWQTHFGISHPQPSVQQLFSNILDADLGYGAP